MAPRRPGGGCESWRAGSSSPPRPNGSRLHLGRQGPGRPPTGEFLRFVHANPEAVPVPRRGSRGAGNGRVLVSRTSALRPPMLASIERLGLDRNGPNPTLAIALGRPDLLDAPAWGSGAERRDAPPRSAPPRESEELVRQAGGGRIAEPEAIEIANRTGGNPFFIVETTGMVLRARQDGAAASGRELPPTVQAVVAARLDSLRHRLRDLARRASVFIFSFDRDELATVSDADPTTCEGLEEAEVLVRDDAGRTPKWRFRHETVREVAYESLPKRERRTLHQQVADADGVGSPLVRGRSPRARGARVDRPRSRGPLAARPRGRRADPGRRPRSPPPGEPLGGRLLRAGARDGRPGGAGGGHGRLERSRGPGRRTTGSASTPAASEALARAVTLGERFDDVWTLALALRYQGDIAINVDGDLDQAEKLLADSIAAAGGLDDAWAMSRSLLFAGWVPWTREDFDGAESLWQRALELAEEHDDSWARVRALTALSINSVPAGGPRRGGQADRPGSRAGRRDGRSVQRRGHDGPAGAARRGPGGRGAIGRFDRAIEIFKELGARWELADALAERGSVIGTSGGSTRRRGGPARGDPDLGKAGRAADRRVGRSARSTGCAAPRGRRGGRVRGLTPRAWLRAARTDRGSGRRSTSPHRGGFSAGCSTSATTRSAMNRPVRTASAAGDLDDLYHPLGPCSPRRDGRRANSVS